MTSSNTGDLEAWVMIGGRSLENDTATRTHLALIQSGEVDTGRDLKRLCRLQ